MKRYRPHAPDVGDVIYKAKDWTIAVNRPEELDKLAGVIIDVIRPDHGPLLDYLVAIKHVDGSVERAHSQELKDFGLLTHNLKTYSRYQEQLLERLQKMSEPQEDIDVDM